MRRISDRELSELKSWTVIKIVWYNSIHHRNGGEYYGTIYGDEIRYSDGLVDRTRTIAEAMYNDECMVYLMEN